MYFHTQQQQHSHIQSRKWYKILSIFLMVISIYYTNQEFWQFLNYHIKKIIFIFIHLDYFNYKDLGRLNCQNQLLIAHSSNSLGSSYSKRIESLNRFSLKSEFSGSLWFLESKAGRIPQLFQDWFPCFLFSATFSQFSIHLTHIFFP